MASNNERLLLEQKQILEKIAAGNPLTDVLNALCSLMEAQSEGMLCSILLNKGEQYLEHGAAPSLPADYVAAIDGLPIGPNVGSCGTAAHQQASVVATDITSDPRWADYRQVALEHGLRACWSTPIFSSTDDLLGTFAMYYRQPHEPTYHEHDLVETATHLAGVAIERAQTVDSLRKSEAQYRMLFEQSKDAVYLVDPENRLMEANQATLVLFGYSRAEIIDRDIREFYSHPHELERFRQAFRRRGYVKDFEVTLLRKEGQPINGLVTYNPLRDSAGHLVAYQGIVRDVTEQKKLREQLSYLAHRDPLTGLFNRRHFEEELERQLTPHQGQRPHGALLWIDVDRFKGVNDNLGHHAGDTLLNHMATLLQETLRESDVIARIGGDEFGVLCPGAGCEQAETVAHKLLNAIHERTPVIAGQPLRVTASLGVACYPDHGLRADELMAAADVAMYQAKESGRNRWRVYAPDSAQEADRLPAFGWAQRLQQALELDHFELYAQSVYDLRHDRVHGCELLLRLADEERPVQPGAFLDSAERFGLMADIDRWVVGRALWHAAEHHRAGQPIYFEINLSGQAVGDEELLSLIESRVAETDVSPSYVTFEITETAAITQLYEAKRFIHRLKEFGCKFALDDFGVGFSSFYHLRHLPVDYLKIDGGFIRCLTDDPMNQRIVQAMVTIARSSELATIAEFVEDEAVFQLLKDFGVDYAQGFYIDRPHPLTTVSA